MKIEFAVGDVIEGLEKFHSMRDGVQEIWHRIEILSVCGDMMFVKMIDDTDIKPFWVKYNPDFFRSSSK